MIRETDRWDVRRFAVLLLALLQFGGPAAVQVADALLEAREIGSPLHIESPHSEGCDHGHSHLICQTVRSLSSGLPSAVSDLPPLVEIAPATLTIDAAALHATVSISGPLGSRAPPLA